MRVLRSFLPPVLFWVIAGCSNSSGPSTTQNAPPPTANPSSDITINQGASLPPYNAFNPSDKSVSLAASGGTATIRWINTDISDGGNYQTGTATTHQIMSDNAAFATSPLLGGNATYTINLTAAGPYTYHCNIHPNMKGTITVNP
jgi:plastocyanin